MDCCYKKENDGSRYVLITEENTAKLRNSSNEVMMNLYSTIQ